MCISVTLQIKQIAIKLQMQPTGIDPYDKKCDVTMTMTMMMMMRESNNADGDGDEVKKEW